MPIRIWARPQEVDEGAPRQLRAVAGLPWVAHHVAVMADVHVGKGMSIGTVVALRGAIAPAAVGVDIGCGMLAAGVRRVSARPLLGPSAYKNIERVMEQ
ncbi:MAG TPA: RtcB family protein, partial [Polyangiaceae bacterium]